MYSYEPYEVEYPVEPECGCWEDHFGIHFCASCEAEWIDWNKTQDLLLEAEALKVAA